MSVAALQALALRRALAEGQRNLAPRFFAAAAKPIDQAWQLATGADLALAVVTPSPPRSVRAMNAYIRRFHAAAAHDPILTRQFLRVSGLLTAPAALMKPSVAMRVLIRSLQRSSPATEKCR
jgi:hypothetical protein